MRKFDITTIGTATHDIFLRTDNIKIIHDHKYATGEAGCFAWGSKIDIGQIAFDTGGGATNTAVSFSRQGLYTGIITKIGVDDSHGVSIIQSLKKEMVSTGQICFDRHRQTGLSVILLSSGGERTVLVYRGASADIQPGDIARHKLNTAWLYVTSLGGRLDTLRYIWRQAKSKGISIAWNPGGQELAHGLSTLKPLLAQCQIINLNVEEFNKLFRNRTDIIKALPKIQKFFKANLIITRAAKGALLVSQGRIYAALPRDIKIVNELGAGDAFGSGYVGEFIKTGDIKKSLAFASLNAESVIQHIGAKHGLLHKAANLHKIKIKIIS